MSDKPVVTLERWTFYPEYNKLYGFAYNHPRFEDGTDVTTTSVLKWIDDRTVETKNTIYKLGKGAKEDASIKD